MEKNSKLLASLGAAALIATGATGCSALNQDAESLYRQGRGTVIDLYKQAGDATGKVINKKNWNEAKRMGADLFGKGKSALTDITEDGVSLFTKPIVQSATLTQQPQLCYINKTPVVLFNGQPASFKTVGNSSVAMYDANGEFVKFPGNGVPYVNNGMGKAGKIAIDKASGRPVILTSDGTTIEPQTVAVLHDDGKFTVEGKAANIAPDDNGKPVFDGTNTSVYLKCNPGTKSEAFSVEFNEKKDGVQTVKADIRQNGRNVEYNVPEKPLKEVKRTSFSSLSFGNGR